MDTIEDKIDALLLQLDCNWLLLSLNTVNLTPLLGEYSNSTHSSSCVLESSPPQVLSLNHPHPCPANSSRFKTLATDSEAKKKAVPKNIEKKTSWAVNIWKQWSAHRCQICTFYCDWPTHSWKYIQWRWITDLVTLYSGRPGRQIVTTTHPILSTVFAVAYWNSSERPAQRSTSVRIPPLLDSSKFWIVR